MRLALKEIGNQAGQAALANWLVVAPEDGRVHLNLNRQAGDGIG